MQQQNLHSILRYFTLLTVVLLMMPIVVKSTFIFEDHHHDICVDDQQESHFHNKDLHCDLYKFTAFNHFISLENHSELVFQEFTKQLINSNYCFLKNHRSLSFSLRGPPYLV